MIIIIREHKAELMMWSMIGSQMSESEFRIKNTWQIKNKTIQLIIQTLEDASITVQFCYRIIINSQVLK